MATQGFHSTQTTVKNMNRNIATLSRWFMLVLILLLPLNCTSKKDENTPLASATPTSFSLTPSSAQVIRGGTQQFTQRGGVGTVSWSVSNTTLATINAQTGVLVASTTPGSLTVTATDASGRSAASAVTIIDSSIILSPATLTLSALGPQTATFTAYGAASTVIYALTGNTNGYKGAAITSGGVFTVTTWPTAAQGSQTLTLTARDGVLSPGTATISLPVTDTRLIVSPATFTLSLNAKQPSTLSASTVTYTATPASSQATGTIFYNLSGQTNSYTGTTINSATGVVTLTTSPTGAQGDQNLTVTASDGTLSGTASLLVTVS